MQQQQQRHSLTPFTANATSSTPAHDSSPTLHSHEQQHDATSIWNSVVISILVTEVAERFAYFGFRAALVLYFRRQLQYDEQTSIALFAYFTSLAYASPLVGALLADASWGRYKTILIFGWIYVLGLIILTHGAFLSSSNETDADIQSTEAEGERDEINDANENDGILIEQRFLTFLGLFLAGMGTGGIKPCVSAFGADQVAHFKNNKRNGVEKDSPVHCESQMMDENVNPVDDQQITMTTITTSSSLDHEQLSAMRVRVFFASFYFCINLGAVSSFAIIPIVRANFGFGAAFLIPTIFLITSMLTFLSKRREYVHSEGGSLLTTFSICFWLIRRSISRNRFVAQCPCLASWIRPSRVPLGGDAGGARGVTPFGVKKEEDESYDKLSTSSPTTNELMSDHHQQLSDARQALKVMPIFAMLPIFWMLYDQQGSVWLLQAARMDLHGLQAEQLNVVNPLEIMIFIPLFDRIIYPLLEQRGWNIVSPLRRMGLGMLLAATSFFVSALVEIWIQHSPENNISVFWQLPQITILAIAEIFLSVTGLEFAYASSPESMKAFLLAIFLSTTAVGNFLGGILYSSVFRGLNRATILFVCGLLMLANLGLFVCVSKGWNKNRKRPMSSDVGIEMENQNTGTIV